MGVVTALLATEVATIAVIVAVLGTKALVRHPRFQQRAIHAEVLVAYQAPDPRQQHRVLEKPLRNLHIELSKRWAAEGSFSRVNDCPSGPETPNSCQKPWSACTLLSSSS
jgi:hypothetical protein